VIFLLSPDSFRSTLPSKKGGKKEQIEKKAMLLFR